MPCYYDSQAIIPAPFVSVQKEYQTTEDGGVVGTVFVIQVKGKMVAWSGSPSSAGVFWTASGYPSDEALNPDQWLGSILRKQEGLRRLFSTEGRTFEVVPLDGATPMKCNPRVKSIQFPEGKWAETAEYVITLEADVVEGLGGQEDTGNPQDYKVSRAAEEWNVEIIDERLRTYRLTHAVSATGKRFYDSAGALTQNAWENARDFCLAKIGLGLKPARMNAPGVLDESLSAYNYIRGQHVGEDSGLFSVSESWVCFDPQGGPPATHEYTGTTRISLADNRTTVEVEGTITGLEVRDTSTHALISTRGTNAESLWANVQGNVLTVAQSISGITLNPISTQTQVGKNPVNGVITYHYTYDTRPVATTPGALTEVISVTNHNAADVFAQIPVLGRPFGPVLQSIGTKTSKRRIISVDIQMPPRSMTFNPDPPTTDGIILALAPSSLLGVFLDSDEESWSPYTGRYTRQSAFVWE